MFARSACSMTRRFAPRQRIPPPRFGKRRSCSELRQGRFLVSNRSVTDSVTTLNLALVSAEPVLPLAAHLPETWGASEASQTQDILVFFKGFGRR